MKKILIIGAGPSGLTAAYELLSKMKNIEVTILEESKDVGGIAKTVNYKGNRMDIGGHRFFSKDARINEWWQQFSSMPVRKRVSHILFNSKLYDYPITLKPETFINLGFINTLKCGISYFATLFHKLPEDNLENFYINRFGKKLYSLFFEYYTENLWGRHPREIDASWGAQRVKGLSISTVFKNIWKHFVSPKNAPTETSLIEEFKYPDLGAGELWENVAQKIISLGGTIITNAKVTKLKKNTSNHISSIQYQKGVENITLTGDIIISSMPLCDLIAGINDVPKDVSKIAKGLPYRDYITLGVLAKKLNLKNKSNLSPANTLIPDCWVYVQDRNVKLGRCQIYNNWSPHLVKDVSNTVWIGLEYFVSEKDSLWEMSEKEFSDFAISEMIDLKLIDSPSDILDVHEEKIKKAYPAYFDTYSEINTLVSYLKTFDNLYCVGRNGQHRYNNMDHSMLTSFEAVHNIITGQETKDNIWSVNTEEVYLETR